MSQTLYLLDGTALLYRAFFALSRMDLTSPDGEPTSAVLGFANTLLAVNQDRPDYVGVVFDAPGPTFRHESFPEYKANRAEMPDDLRLQIPRVRELVEAWPAALLEVPGVEADDVIGSYAVQLAGPDLEVVVVTGDKDFYQVLSPHVRLLDPGRGGAAAIQTRMVGPDDIPAKFGVTEPHQVVDVLALMGDTSDNVPGVPGVGPKTAGQLIAAHGSVAGLYRSLDQVKPALREKLLSYRETVERALDLVTIRTDLELPRTLEDLRRREPQGEPLVQFLNRLGFRRLLRELGLEGTPGAGTGVELFDRRDHYRLVNDAASLHALAERLARAPSGFALDTETSSVDPMRARLVGIAFATAPGEAAYVNVGHDTGPRISPAEVGDVLGPVLGDPRLPKIAHHAKVDLLVLERAGLRVEGLAFDTMIASYLLDPEGSHGLDDLARARLKETTLPIADLLGPGGRQRTMAEVDPGAACRYAAEDADMTYRLRDLLEPELAQAGLLTLFRDVEMPLLHVLKEMQKTGVALDVEFLREMSRGLEQEMAGLEAECLRLAETNFNIHSSPQLAEVLFDRLALPRGKRTKTGYSTDSEVLEGLRPLHPLPGKILEYRLLAKLGSTYVDALPKLLHPETGRIHASFNQTVAATGRLSSSDPNLQNIPIRTPRGRDVRRAFVPGRPGWVLLSADYSQIELRIMAHLSHDPAMLDAFSREVDIHRDTASRLFGVPPEAITTEQRNLAKTVNFGILYGQGPYGLARTLGISNAEAARFIKAYRAQYQGVVRYLEETVTTARRNGYVTTLLNRRRPLPQLRSASPAVRAAAERLAINTPIQGSAADLIKVAMVDLARKLAAGPVTAHLLLQVHDELVLECPREDAPALSRLVRESMEGALALDVPVVVNVGVGANWAEIH